MNVKKIFKRIITGFVALTTAATMFIGNGVSANCLQGDVNSDGTINIYDVIYISSCLAKNDITTIKNSGDYNKDGAVNIYDAVAIAKSFIKRGPVFTTINLNTISKDIYKNCKKNIPLGKYITAEVSCRTASAVNDRLICYGFFDNYQTISDEEPLYLCIDVEIEHLTFAVDYYLGIEYVSNTETESVFGWAEVKAISEDKYSFTMLGWDSSCYGMSEEMRCFLQDYSPNRFIFADGMEMFEVSF